MTLARSIVALILVTLCCGCVGVAGQYARDVTQSAVVAADDPATKKRLDDLASSLATAVVTGAREEALNPESIRRIRDLFAQLLAEARAQLRAEAVNARTSLLGPETQALLVTDVGALAEPLRSDAADLREELLGAPFRADLNAAVDELAPHLAKAMQTSLDSLRVQAEAEASRWKWVAVGLGAAGFVLLIGALVMAREMRAHRKELLTIMAGHGR